MALWLSVKAGEPHAPLCRSLPFFAVRFAILCSPLTLFCGGAGNFQRGSISKEKLNFTCFEVFIPERTSSKKNGSLNRI